MERAGDQQIAMMPIEFKLNGETVVGRPDEPIIRTAKQHGINIPHLCHGGNQRSDGNCRACVVEIKGERALAPSCCRFPSAGMEVTTNSARALASQKMVLELLLSDMPKQQYTRENKVLGWAKRLGVGEPRFAARQQPKADISHPAIAVNLDACIQCTRCVRACREVQVNDVIGYAYRGDQSVPVFDCDDPPVSGAAGELWPLPLPLELAPGETVAGPVGAGVVVEGLAGVSGVTLGRLLGVATADGALLFLWLFSSS